MKQIPGYSHYSIDKCGNVYSTKRQLPKLLKTFKRGIGYLGVALYRDGEKHQWFVHRLVALTYLGDSDLLVLHNDGNQLNNCLDNLRYGTQSDNIIDSSRHGTHPVRKLSDDEVRDIRNSSGSFASIGRQFGVHYTTIKNVLSGITFKHIT